MRDWAGHHSITETSKYVHATAESWRRAATVSTGLVHLAEGALASGKVSTIDAKGATLYNSVQKHRQTKTHKNTKEKAEMTRFTHHSAF